MACADRRPRSAALGGGACCLVVLQLLAPSLAAQQSEAYASWHASLRDLAPDPARGAMVQNLRVEHDAGAFHLADGQMHLLLPVSGRTIGAVFSGEGTFETSTPDAVEAAALEREFGSGSPSLPFRNVVFLFSAGSDSTLLGDLDWAPMEPPDAAEDEAEEARDYFTDDDGWVSRKVLLPLLNDAPDFFWAHLSEDRGDPTIFAFDPLYFEEVTISKRADRGKRPEVVAQFHRQADYERGTSTPQEGLDLLDIAGYEIETEIEGNLDLVGRSTVTLQRRFRQYRWVPFRLYPELEVDSVHWADGTPIDFHRAEETSDVWLDLGAAPALEERALTFHYSGRMMDRPQRLWVVIESHSNWYPVYEFGREIPYRMTFRTPDEYVVAAVGERVSVETTDDRTTTVWETEPVRSVTFNLGEFEPFESVEPGAPGLTVLVNEAAHRRLGDLAWEAGAFLLQQRDMAEQVAVDVRNAFRIFNEIYGPTQLDRFVATEIPFSHGEAHPGLVMLAWNTFQWTSEEGFDEMFRAHEVAHQWWGISVRPASYRDWWLAEGFSEYAGWWYATRIRGSLDMYLRRLEETREEILDRAEEAGPIVLGRRVATSAHPEDYQLMVYYKGAWVLHMLRTMLTDPETGSDETFVRIMRTFYERNLGGTATTRGFQAVVEEVVGTSMAWFFDQWVFGTGIPEYRFAHRYEEQPDGSVKATVRVRQGDVPESFQMLVPVRLDFGAEGSATVTIPVSGPETVHELPILPREPDRIEFNPDFAVLARMRTEGWNDR